MKKDLFRGLTEEQIDKILQCNNPTEVLELAKQEGITLTDDQLEAVYGGSCGSEDDDKKNKRKIDS